MEEIHIYSQIFSICLFTHTFSVVPSAVLFYITLVNPLFVKARNYYKSGKGNLSKSKELHVFSSAIKDERNCFSKLNSLFSIYLDFTILRSRSLKTTCLILF